jgi:hypothetical protein
MGENTIDAQPTPSVMLAGQRTGRGLRLSLDGPVPHTTRLSVNGSTSVVVTPPLPCGLAGCVAELHITGKHGDTQRVHLSAQQRRELVIGLGSAP